MDLQQKIIIVIINIVLLLLIDLKFQKKNLETSKGFLGKEKSKDLISKK